MRNILIILIIFQPLSLFTQSERGEIIDYYPQKNGDTLAVTRWYGDYWYGIQGGANYNQFFGDYVIGAHPHIPPAITTDELEFFASGENGSGVFLGFVFEYNPSESEYGGLFRLNIIDINHLVAVTDIIQTEDEDGRFTDKIFQNDVNLRYYNLSLSGRYTPPWKGFHFIGGFNIDILNGLLGKYHSTRTDKFKNGGSILNEIETQITNIKTRYGVHAGVGWDLLIGDINNGLKVRMTPFATVNYSTKYFGLNEGYFTEPSINSLNLKLGVMVKFGPDNSESKILKFDPSYRIEGPGFAERYADAIVFNGLTEDRLGIESIDYIKARKIIDAVREEPQYNSVIAEEEEEEEEDLVEIKANAVAIYEFSDPKRPRLSQDLVKYLKSVAKFIKDNPASEVRVVAHSDNQGSPQENNERARKRMEKVVQYLVINGVPKGQIYERSDGALKPVGDNRTPAGRRKNRRVEIMVVKK